MTASEASTPDALYAFLRVHVPFSGMADDVLRAMVPQLRVAAYAPQATILTAGAGPVQDLHIVRQGLVGSHAAHGEGEPDRVLGMGELFPVGALSAGTGTDRTFRALGPATCLLLPRQDFLALREASPQFERYCTRAITETLRQSLERLYGEYRQRATEQQALARTLGEIVRRPPVLCHTDDTVRTACERMQAARVRTIVVTTPDDRPAGMFTLVDLLRRVVLPGVAPAVSIAEVMTTPIVTLPATATASEALALMAQRALRQVVVTEAGRVRGVVSERDLFALQRISMRQVIETLHAADSIGSLQHAAEDIRSLTQNLLAQGVAAEALTRTIAALNDALARRAIEFASVTHPLDGVRWCWLSLGSEGRGEQTFATDQDNALVFDAPATEVEARRGQLLAFARTANAHLAALGFPLCAGNVMAGNPEYCLSAPEWKGRFLAWIREPTPEALLAANIVFDFRPLQGDLDLADSLRAWLLPYAQANAPFLRLLAQNALSVEPPLGLLRTFTLDADAAGRPTLDLKTRGTRLFVDCARVFALAHGIAETGTEARLRLAAAKLRVAPRHLEATLAAFQFLQLLRLREQHRGRAPEEPNRIDPEELHAIDQRMLKEALREARALQDRLRTAYRL